MAANCQSAGQIALAEALETTATTANVSHETATLTLRLLENAFPIPRPGLGTRLFHRLCADFRRAWFTPPATPRKRLVLMDRSLLDFLFLDRKSDTPHFSSWHWLANLFGTRLPHVHLVVPFARLQERKCEMTRAGQEIYDTEMFRYFSRRTPTDYVVFDNRGPLEDSTAALSRIVD